MINKRGKRRDKFYKGRYLIALYDEIDRLITICDNAYEFKEFLDIPTINTSYSILSKVYLGRIKTVNYRGERLKVHFISLSADEQVKLEWHTKLRYS